MTGQVKEDVLCRFGELGVVVREGEIHFHPALLRRDEFARERVEFVYYDISGDKQRRALKAGELAFTYCQVPIIYRLAQANALTILRAGGSPSRTKELQLDAATSRVVFERTGDVTRIEVDLSLKQSRQTR